VGYKMSGGLITIIIGGIVLVGIIIWAKKESDSIGK